MVLEFGDPAAADVVLGYVAETANELGQLLGRPAAIAELLNAYRSRGSVAMIAVIRYDDDLEVAGRAPHTVDITAADSAALTRELTRVSELRRETGQPVFEIIGQGDGAAVARAARDQLPERAAGLRELPAAQPPAFDLTDYSAPPDAGIPGPSRGEFENPIAGATGGGEQGGVTALLRLLAEQSRWAAALDDAAEVARLAALVECLNRAHRAVAVQPADSGALPSVRPLALPVSVVGDSRSFVLIGDLISPKEVTVFVTATEPTPEALRSGLHSLPASLGDSGTRAAAVWQGTDPAVLAGDLRRLAEALPTESIRLVIVGESSELVRLALDDDQLAAQEAASRSATTPIRACPPRRSCSRNCSATGTRILRWSRSSRRAPPPETPDGSASCPGYPVCTRQRRRTLSGARDSARRRSSHRTTSW